MCRSEAAESFHSEANFRIRKMTNAKRREWAIHAGRQAAIRGRPRISPFVDRPVQGLRDWWYEGYDRMTEVMNTVVVGRTSNEAIRRQSKCLK